MGAMSEHQHEPPRTGDEHVDRALTEFAAHRDADLGTRLGAATEAHRQLQQRLTNPGSGPQHGE